MTNWFGSALKAASSIGRGIENTASGITSAAGEAANGLVKSVQNTFSFSSDEALAFFEVLFSVAAADGMIDESELSMILASPEIAKLSAEQRDLLQVYSFSPPPLEESIQKLANAKTELQFGLIFCIIDLIRADKKISAGEKQAFQTARRALKISDAQVTAIKDYIQSLDDIKNQRNELSLEKLRSAAERLKEVGVPINVLAQSNSNIAEEMTYSDDKFWEKISGFGSQAGRALVEPALVSWHTLHDPATPNAAKLVIAGALAYLIFPADMVPDVLPAVGFSDDLATILGALSSIAYSVTPEARAKAKKQTDDLFSDRKGSVGDLEYGY